jgi:hypothetical protein
MHNTQREGAIQKLLFESKLVLRLACQKQINIQDCLRPKGVLSFSVRLEFTYNQVQGQPKTNLFIYMIRCRVAQMSNTQFGSQFVAGLGHKVIIIKDVLVLKLQLGTHRLGPCMCGTIHGLILMCLATFAAHHLYHASAEPKDPAREKIRQFSCDFSSAW